MSMLLYAVASLVVTVIVAWFVMLCLLIDGLTEQDQRKGARAVTSPMEAVCLAAGWIYCAEHDRAKRDSIDGCLHLHGGEAS